MKKFIAALVAALFAGLGVTALAAPAQAHTPKVSTSCEALSVDLTNYRVKAEHPETFKTVHHEAVGTPTIEVTNPEYVPGVPAVTHTEWKYVKHGGLGQVWVDNDTWKYLDKDGTGYAKRWEIPGYKYPFYERTQDTRVVTDVEEVPAQGTPTIEIPNPEYVAPWDEQVSNNDYAPAKVNHVTVTVNGTVVADEDFNQAYSKTFAFAPDQANTYEVVVTAWDDPSGQHGWTFTKSGTQEGCITPPPVNYCDPSQKPGGMSIAKWLATAPDDFDVASCFEVTPSLSCGEFNATLTGPYAYAFQWVEGADQAPIYPGANSMPATFPEDYNGGSVQITTWIVGPEKDYLLGSGLPNFWEGNGRTVTIDTDCIPPKPQDSTGVETRTLDLVCHDPLDGQGDIVTEERHWTQTRTWNGEEWVLGQKVYGEWTVKGTETVDDASCIPPKPEPKTGTEQWSIGPDCNTPLDGTATTQIWGRDWTRDSTWDVETHAYVLGEKTYGENYLISTDTSKSAECTPPPPVTPPTEPPTLASTGGDLTGLWWSLGIIGVGTALILGSGYVRRTITGKE